MKIEQRLNYTNNRNVINKAENDDRLTIKSKTSLFSDFFDKYGEDHQQEHILDLLDKIQKQGERLKKNLSITELRYYKRMVAEFLQFAVSDMYEFKKEHESDRQGRKRVIILADKVNEKMEELTEAFLEEEKDHIGIMKMMDDIRGMLVDITM